jgi:N-dimethylarginine dimethylaminohydrolase|tara:strand:- start:2756 stop:3763 length:1008 start_codon:yes stop_codon:yes gene_type:complete
MANEREEYIKIPNVSEPSFETNSELIDIWGRNWGCDSDVGKLKTVLMHPPTEDILRDPRKRLVASNEATDERDQGWYWDGDECMPRTQLPIDEMRDQWDGLLSVLEAHEVEIIRMQSVTGGRFSHYTRDSAIAVQGGAIICRLRPYTRRGEEVWATKSIAQLGMPIIRTITGKGMLEGGSFTWLDSQTVIVGRSNCVNEEAVVQLEEILKPQGIEVLRADLSFFDIHIDGVFGMLSHGVAMVDKDKLPFVFLEELQKRHITLIPITKDDDPWVLNSLVIEPGKVVMPEGLSAVTRKRLDHHHIEVITIPFDKVHLNGGGIRCSTCPLIRESIQRV